MLCYARGVTGHARTARSHPQMLEYQRFDCGFFRHGRIRRTSLHNRAGERTVCQQAQTARRDAPAPTARSYSDRVEASAGCECCTAHWHGTRASVESGSQSGAIEVTQDTAHSTHRHTMRGAHNSDDGCDQIFPSSKPHHFHRRAYFSHAMQIRFLWLLACTIAAISGTHAAAPSRTSHVHPLHDDLSLSPADRARQRGQLQAAAVAGRPEWRADASSMLRVAMDWNEEAEADARAHAAERTSRIGSGSTMQLAADHFRELTSALWLPVDWLVHTALGGQSEPSHATGFDGTSHPLHPTIEAAMQLIGMQPVTAKPRRAAQTAKPRSLHSTTQLSAATVTRTPLLTQPRVLPSPLATPPSSNISTCSDVGRQSNATRTLFTCLTASDDAQRAQPFDIYMSFQNGTLLDVFAEEPFVVLDASITPNINCSTIWQWLSASDWVATNVTAADPSYPQADLDTQQSVVFQACTNLTVVEGALAEFSGNSSLVQHCQLFERCYARAHFCHQWIDIQPFCICPFDRTGSRCEQHVKYQCDVRLAWPIMDIQRYTDEAGQTHTYSCVPPRSFATHFPATNNPGTNSKIKMPPQTDLQRKYAYDPNLDGTPPCIEYPAASAQSNPSLPTVADPQQEFRYALDCAFMSDQDPTGQAMLSIRAENEQPLTYSQIAEAPSADTISWLQSGGFAWNSNYTTVSPPFSYDVLRRASDGSVQFAVSVVDSAALRVRVHPQNFHVISDSSYDVLSEPASIAALQSAPSDETILAAGLANDVASLRDVTVGVRIDVTSLPRGVWLGGRYRFECSVDFALDTSADNWWTFIPPGIDVNAARWPLRLVLESRDYVMAPPKADRTLSMLAIFLLVLLGITVIAVSWRVFEWRREEKWRMFVEKTKQAREQDKRRAQREKEAREALRSQTQNALQ